LKDNFKISFRISPFQEFEKGSLVTYRDENFLGYLQSNFYSRSSFFYIKNIDWEKYACEISNTIDTVMTTPDQLVEVVAYIEKISDYPNNYTKNTIENIIRWDEAVKNTESYVLYDQKMGIYLEDSIFTNDSFLLINIKIDSGESVKMYKAASFIENRLSDIL